MKYLIIFTAMGSTLITLAYAEVKQGAGLNEQLDRLMLPSNIIENSVAKEKLYSVQRRYAPLKKRLELSLGGSTQVTNTGFVSQRELTLGGRYYLSPKWSVGATYSYAFNSLTDSSEDLFREEGILPQVPFVKQRAEVTARYLIFYGKFRLNMDKVLYFDHFISLGPAFMRLDTGDSAGVVGDTGLVFWFGHKWNTSFGIKHYVFEKKNIKAEKYLANQAQVYFNIGLLY